MKENKKVKVPVYVAEFLDDIKSTGTNLIGIINELIDIYDYYHNSEVYYEDSYRKVMIASWVKSN